MLKYLLPLALYDLDRLYDFNEDDPETHTPTTTFQRYFLNVIYAYKGESQNVKEDLIAFNYEMSVVSKNMNKVPRSEAVDECLGTKTAELLYGFIVEVSNLPTDVLNKMNKDEQDRIQVPDTMDVPMTLEEMMYQLAPVVLADVLDESLGKVRLKTSISEDGEIFVNWDIHYLHEGFDMEMALMISTAGFIKKCENPTCCKYFNQYGGHSTRKYCCHKCGVAVAKRRQRQRDAEEPNRPRIKPGFKSRKKPE